MYSIKKDINIVHKTIEVHLTNKKSTTKKLNLKLKKVGLTT